MVEILTAEIPVGHPFKRKDDLLRSVIETTNIDVGIYDLVKLEVAIDTRNILHSIFCELSKQNRLIAGEE